MGAAAARLRPLKLGRPLKHRQAIAAGTTLDNARAMAVTKQVPPALKNRWLGRVAARVALERLAGGFEAFEGFEAGQTAGLNALKNRWLGRVAARVALERPAGALEGFDKRSEKQNAVAGVAPEWNREGPWP